MGSETSDLATVEAMKRGDHAAFAALVRLHQAAFLRLARAWVKDSASSAEVVQQAWLTALESIASFEGRSTLRTWLYGVVVNVARAHVRAQKRLVPLSALIAEEAIEGPTVDPARFATEGEWVGHWTEMPPAFPSPDASLERERLRGLLEDAIAQLPPIQQQIMVLCDVEGLTGEEACNILGISRTHQRVLLHRARAKARALLEARLSDGER